MAACLHQERLEACLRQPQPSLALEALAARLKSEGITQLVMYRLYDEYRRKHENDTDPVSYEAILNTMDYIAGWCGPAARLFETVLPRNGD